MSETFQDLLGSFANQIFVGREEPILAFRHALSAPRPPFLILALSGPGGVGKSTLLQRLQRLTIENGSICLSVEEEHHSVVQVLADFARQLRTAGHPFDALEEQIETYRRLKARIEADTAARKSWLDYASRNATRIGLRTLHRIPVAGEAADVPVPGERAAAGPSTARLKQEKGLLLDATGELTRHLVRELNDTIRFPRLTFFFDTYEQTAPHLDHWLRQFIGGAYGAFSSRVLFVIAGRQPLGRRWAAYQDAVAHLRLEPFTPDEAGQYLRLSGITDPQQVKELSVLSQGLPVLLALLTTAPGEANTEFADSALDRFLQDASEGQRSIALAAAVPRFFNAEIVQALLPEPMPLALFDWLRRSAFVSLRSHGWVYHNVVRRLMLRHLYQQAPDKLRSHHVTLRDHFAAAAAALDLTPASRREDKQWRRLERQRLYHAVSAAPATVSAIVASLLRTLEHDFVLDEMYEIVFSEFASLVDQLAGEIEHAPLQTLRTLLAEAALHLFVDSPTQEDARAAIAFFRTLAEFDGLDNAAQGIAYRLEGKAALDSKDSDHALVCFTRAVALDPANAETFHWRGRVQRRLGRFATAITDFTTAIELAPDDESHYYWRGRTHHSAECYPAAIADFTAAIERQPHSGDTYYWRGDAYLATGDEAAAIADFTAAIELQPARAFNYHARGLAHLDAGDHAAAIADFSTALEHQPDDGNVYFWRGRAHCTAKNVADAVADFTTAIELLPDDGAIYRWRGRAHHDAGDYTAAITDFTAAIELQPRVATHYSARGLAHCDAGHYAAAIADFSAAIERQPGDGDAYRWRGRAHHDVGDYTAAITDFTTAIELLPDNGYNYHGRGRTHYAAANYLAAIADFSNAIELLPENGHNYHARGRAHLKAGNYAAAIADFTAAIELQPGDGVNYRWRGLTQHGAGNHAAAIADFTAAIELQPDDGYNYRWRGCAHYAAGEYAAAIADLTVAIERLPANGVNYFWRGRAHHDAEAHAAAIADFTTAIELQPDRIVNYAHRGATYLSLGDSVRAEADFARVEQLLADSGIPAYIVAAAYARHGSTGPACVWLARAIARSPHLGARADADADFAPIRRQLAFQSIISAAP